MVRLAVLVLVLAISVLSLIRGSNTKQFGGYWEKFRQGSALVLGEIGVYENSGIGYDIGLQPACNRWAGQRCRGHRRVGCP
jgi:hypothetical protein